MSYYCSHCGSQDTPTASTGNDPEGELIVIEQFDFADEVWDGDMSAAEDSFSFKSNRCYTIPLYTHPASADKQAVRVPEWVSVIEDNCWDLRCVSRSTGGDDCDVIWQVIEHHMSEPNQRVIAESLYPLDALERALNPIEQEGE